MGTIKQMFSALGALVLLAGCAESPSGDPAEDEALGDSDSQALAACVYPSNDGGGALTSIQGCFSWGNTAIHYKSAGAVVPAKAGPSMGVVSTPALNGDFEIVVFGASDGGDTSTEVNTYFDSAKMTSQGFKAIGVRGEKDKKVEMWVRKNTGQSTIDTPSKARSRNVLVLDGDDVQLNLNGITKSTVESSGQPWKVPTPTGTRLNVLAYFGDDSVEVTDTHGGQMIFNKWGFGDGDSLNVILYQPLDAPPTTIAIQNHAPQGQQYVGMLANFTRL